MFDKPAEPPPVERRPRRGIRVDISGNKLEFPLMCACCCGPAETSLVAIATRTTGVKIEKIENRGWSFPYCSKCLEHFRASEKTFAAIAIALLVLALIVLLLAAPHSFCSGFVPVGLACFVVYAWQENQIKQTAESMCSTSCVGAASAVSYLGWDGSIHSFLVDNEEFALEFMRANRKKLVNADYSLVPLIEAHALSVETITRTIEK